MIAMMRPMFRAALVAQSCASWPGAGCVVQHAVRSISSSAFVEAPLAASRPSQQAKAKKPAGGGAATPVVEEKYDLTKQIPVNLLKGACGCGAGGVGPSRALVQRFRRVNSERRSASRELS